MGFVLQDIRLWDPSDPGKTALVVDGDRVGDGTSMVDEIIDGGGCTVTPGLVDAHVHLVMGALYRRGVDLSECASRQACLAALHEAAPSLDAGAWLIGHGWNEQTWPDATPPDRTWLAEFGDRPVVCWRCDLHAAVVNDVVLEHLADAALSDAARHTGVLVEADAWECLIPAMPQPTADDSQAALRDAALWLGSMGITAVRTMEYRDELEHVIDPIAAELPLRITVTMLDRTLPLDLAWIKSRATALPRVIGCKAFFDGTIGSRTARMASPYLDRGEHGIWVELALRDEDEQWCAAVVDAGLTPSIHAIGDAAVARAIRVLQDVPRELHASIEHAEVVPDDAALYELMTSMCLSVQPVHRFEDAPTVERCMDPAVMKRLLPLRRLLDDGAPLAFGTDWPVTSADPMRTFAAAITGRDVDGRVRHAPITSDEAMRCMTTEAAAMVGLSTGAGLTPGAPADFVIWDTDPLSWDGHGDPPRPRSTWIGGVQVWPPT